MAKYIIDDSSEPVNSGFPTPHNVTLTSAPAVNPVNSGYSDIVDYLNKVSLKAVAAEEAAAFEKEQQYWEEQHRKEEFRRAWADLTYRVEQAFFMEHTLSEEDAYALIQHVYSTLRGIGVAVSEPKARAQEPKPFPAKQHIPEIWNNPNLQQQLEEAFKSAAQYKTWKLTTGQLQ